MQGNYASIDATVLVNAHQSPFTLSPIVKLAKMTSAITSKGNPKMGDVIVTAASS